MKPLSKIIILSIIILCIPFTLEAQKKKQEVQSKTRINLFEYKKHADKYFDSIRSNLKSKQDSSEFYAEGSEYNNYELFLNYWFPRLFSASGDFSKYFEASKSFYSKSLGSKLESGKGNTDAWKELGPITTPINYRGIGPTEFITFFDKGTYASTDYMLVGALTSGLFYSTDHGQHWQKTGTDTKWAESGCSSAVFHPTDHKTWYASSSGNSGSGNSSFIGRTGGIYRTRDEGVTWTQIADYTKFDNNDYLVIYKLLIDPVNPSILYAATSAGIYKSTDCDSPSPTWSNKIGGVAYDLEMKPNEHNVLYATLFDQQDSSWYVIKSGNQGSGWTRLPLPLVLTSIGRGIDYLTEALTIEISRARPDYLYCLAYNGGSSKLFYFDFNDSGNQWKHVNIPDFVVYMGAGHGFGVDQAVDGNVIYYSVGTEAYKVNIQNPQAIYLNRSHCDIEDIVSNPYNSAEIWVAHHGGVDKTNPLTNSNQLMVDGLGVAEIMRMAASYSSPEYLLLGQYHDGTTLTKSAFTNNGLPSWKLISSGDGNRPLIDNINPQNMWSSSQYGGWVLSEDYFNNQINIENKLSPWMSEGVLNKVDPSIFYRVWNYPDNTKYQIACSFDKGVTNHIIGTFDGYIIGLYTSFTNKDYLVVSWADNNWVSHLSRTKNSTGNNVTWEELKTPRTNNGWINSICYDSYNPDIIYIAYSCSDNENNWPQANNMIFRIDYSDLNNVKTSNLTMNLPYTFTGVDCLALEKGSNEGLYLSTDFGVFYTNKTLMMNQIYWQLFGSELPHVASNGLEINYAINRIRIGTWGRGEWEKDLYCPQDANLTESGTYTGTKFIEAKDNITSTVKINSGTITYRAGKSISLEPGFMVKNGSIFKAFIHPCDKAGNSFDPNSNP